MRISRFGWVLVKLILLTAFLLQPNSATAMTSGYEETGCELTGISAGIFRRSLLTRDLGP